MNGSTCKKSQLRQETGGEADNSELKDLWNDADDVELDELEQEGEELTISLAGGDAAAIRKLSSGDTEENLGRTVQPDGCADKHIAALKDKMEEWTTKVCGSQLTARAV